MKVARSRGRTTARRGASEGSAPGSGWKGAAWAVALLWFALGLLCRLVIFAPAPHLEGDEIVYQVLVGQLDAGHGYTLVGTPLLDVPSATGVGRSYPADQYGRALFFHPPGGIALVWLLHRIVGAGAFPLAQVLSYALFFWSLLALARSLFPPLAGVRLHLVAALAAFTPLMTHVTSRYWLDGPMLAVTTLAAALFVRAVRWQDMRGSVVAALVLGYASWIKAAALVAAPGMLLLAWAVAAPERRRGFVRLGFVFVAVTALVQLPWEIWQWLAVGSPFPAWAGRPSPEMVADNPYVRYVTLGLSPWIYLTLLPRVIWTLVPSLAGLAVPGLDARARRLALALVVWIVVVVGTVTGLGAAGYSKLMRYAILVTPATVLLFALVAGQAWAVRTDATFSPRARRLAAALVVLAAAGLLLEIAQGIHAPLLDPGSDRIVPVLLRGPGWW